MPHRALARRHERLILSRLTIDLGKLIQRRVYGDGANFAASIDGAFVAVAVSLGHAENKPMNASKIALYLGMPRTTVLRKLAELEELNIIVRKGNTLLLSPQVQIDSGEIDKAKRMLFRACAALTPQ